MKSSGVSKVWSYTVEKHMKVCFAVVDVRTRRGLLDPRPGPARNQDFRHQPAWIVAMCNDKRLLCEALCFATENTLSASDELAYGNCEKYLHFALLFTACANDRVNLALIDKGLWSVINPTLTT